MLIFFPRAFPPVLPNEPRAGGRSPQPHLGIPTRTRNPLGESLLWFFLPLQPNEPLEGTRSSKGKSGKLQQARKPLDWREAPALTGPSPDPIHHLQLARHATGGGRRPRASASASIMDPRGHTPQEEDGFFHAHDGACHADQRSFFLSFFLSFFALFTSISYRGFFTVSSVATLGSHSGDLPVRS